MKSYRFIQKLHFNFIDFLAFKTQPFSAPLVPATVWTELDCYRNDPTGLKKYFSQWKTAIKFLAPSKKELDLKLDYVLISGEYFKRKCILYVYTKLFKTFKFTDKTWDLFKFRIIQALMHELIHFSHDINNNRVAYYSVARYKKTGNAKIDQLRKYHSDKSEITAYAHCILLDFKNMHPNTPVEKMVKRCKEKNDSDVFDEILDTFDRNFNNNSTLKMICSHILRWDKKYQKLLTSTI